MLDILSAFLNDSVTPELKTAIEEAHAVFERIELPNYEHAFEEILVMHDEVDISETSIHITNLTVQLLHQMLLEHGITATDDTRIDVLTTLANAVLDIPDYDNKPIMLDAAMADGTAEDVMAEIMALVTEHNADELFIHLENVSPSLIKRIQEIMFPTNEHTELDDEALVKREQVENFVRLQNYLIKPIPRVAEMLTNGLSAGLPFVVYADLIGRDFESMTVEAAAQEFVAIALLSKDGKANPTSMIKEHIEHYISNLDKVTQVFVAVSDLLIGFKP